MLFAIYDWSLVYFLAQSDGSSSASGGTFGGLFGLIFGLAAYVFTSYCFYKIYEKLGEENAWFAWVPILQYWIMYKAGNQSPYWIIGLFIPFVNLAAAIFLLIAFVNIVKKLGKNPWLILLMLIPIVNFVILYQFALG
ncbi:hypothetical protein F7734_20850 [Scytonema sp. UIC 10036]|uniref:DUF5684 domain-containing protein n=1 Tax=Scytonema sp. UIC 10036 TaxID=2304196 RepID=UPI0012DA1D37|nr:DUF5684 domain-containing protein [Scytonema sp. UIC 10036]MUG94677.1 hypothetical protein [Scytonema sp. UIC 10036]